ncbi:MAG: hypothetical protein JHC52_10110 [Chthoniobacterales bacterium]|nr:hypothetical protein [Chthoniobacterales bacterium]
MFARLLLTGLIFFLVVAGALMFFGPLMRAKGGAAKLPACPYLQKTDLAGIPPEVVGAVGAYEAIRETLARDSIEGVAAQAEVIARAFAATDPKLSACAKRLAGEQDLESARRAFMRLNRLMEKNAQQAAPGKEST